MKQRVRSTFRWLGFTCLIALGCTKLEDPNQWFGDIVGGSAGELSGGSDVGAGTGGSRAGAGGGNAAAGTSMGGRNAGAGGMLMHEGDAGDAGAGTTSCIDEHGFHGLGCYRCPPQEIVTLENACTTATCTRFDDAKRLTLLGKDGKLPALPSAPSGTAGAGGATSSGGAGGNSAGAGGSTGGTGKSCADLANLGTVVYVTGSSAASPFLQQIAQQLVAQNVYIVYESTGSCVGVDAVLNGTVMTTGPTAPALTATYWDSAASVGVACDLPAEGVTADIGVSDVFAQSCAGFEFANLDALQVRDAHGPIQTMTFAVATNSPHAEISAEAAYFAFGFGADGGLRDKSGNVAIVGTTKTTCSSAAPAPEHKPCWRPPSAYRRALGKAKRTRGRATSRRHSKRQGRNKRPPTQHSASWLPTTSRPRICARKFAYSRVRTPSSTAQCSRIRPAPPATNSTCATGTIPFGDRCIYSCV
jgi:hypothetical protein